MIDKANNFAKDINAPSKEQIIIDGVDVSGCTFHYQNKEGKHKCFKCDVVAICDGDCSYGAIYLKEQLARKTQLIDEIEEVIKPYQDQIELDALSLPIAIESILERKTHEYEELKVRATIAEDNFACEVQARLYHQSEWLKFSKERERYRKALEEIEKIVNKKTETSICNECACNHIPECKDNCMQDVLENILDIINKVKDGK